MNFKLRKYKAKNKRKKRLKQKLIFFKVKDKMKLMISYNKV